MNKGWFLLLLLLIQLTGCVTIFSEFQSADVLGNGNSEFTLAGSNVRFDTEDESGFAQNNVGLQIGFGVAERMDLRARIEMPSFEGFDQFGEFYVIGFGPKFLLYKSKGIVSFYMPLGAGFGNDIETSNSFQTHPTFLFSYPFRENIEFNTSVKGIFQLGNEGDNLYAVNVGLSIWESEKLGIRPEVGILKSFEDSNGSYYHFGVGLTYRVFK